MLCFFKLFLLGRIIGFSFIIFCCYDQILVVFQQSLRAQFIIGIGFFFICINRDGPLSLIGNNGFEIPVGTLDKSNSKRNSAFFCKEFKTAVLFFGFEVTFGLFFQKIRFFLCTFLLKLKLIFGIEILL